MLCRQWLVLRLNWLPFAIQLLYAPLKVCKIAEGVKKVRYVRWYVTSCLMNESCVKPYQLYQQCLKSANNNNNRCDGNFSTTNIPVSSVIFHAIHTGPVLEGKERERENTHTGQPRTTITSEEAKVNESLNTKRLLAASLTNDFLISVCVPWDASQLFVAGSW